VDPAKLGHALFAADIRGPRLGRGLFETGRRSLGPLGTAPEPEDDGRRGLLPRVGAIGDTLVADAPKDSVRPKRRRSSRSNQADAPGRPAEPDESGEDLFIGMFFDPGKYDFSRVGRFKFNIGRPFDEPRPEDADAEDFFVSSNSS